MTLNVRPLSNIVAEPVTCPDEKLVTLYARVFMNQQGR